MGSKIERYFTTFAIEPPFGKIIGQKYAEGHTGITNVPVALQSFKCLIVDPISEIGGHKKLLSSLQSFVKALTDSVSGQKNLELNLNVFLLLLSVDRERAKTM